VPSVFHISHPVAASRAMKYSRPPETVKCQGSELAAPGLISLNSRVPALVPSVTHNSSFPAVPSALK
jgi:hypothetical protein